MTFGDVLYFVGFHVEYTAVRVGRGTAFWLRELARALVVAPCTGTTLARLAAGLSDTPVTLAAKSLLRVGCPVLLAVSTNDGLGASGENIARLMQRKHYTLCPTDRTMQRRNPRA